MDADRIDSEEIEESGKAGREPTIAAQATDGLLLLLPLLLLPEAVEPTRARPPALAGSPVGVGGAGADEAPPVGATGRDGGRCSVQLSDMGRGAADERIDADPPPVQGGAAEGAPDTSFLHTSRTSSEPAQQHDAHTLSVIESLQGALHSHLLPQLLLLLVRARIRGKFFLTDFHRDCLAECFSRSAKYCGKGNIKERKENDEEQTKSAIDV